MLIEYRLTYSTFGFPYRCLGLPANMQYIIYCDPDYQLPIWLDIGKEVTRSVTAVYFVDYCNSSCHYSALFQLSVAH